MILTRVARSARRLRVMRTSAGSGVRSSVLSGEARRRDVTSVRRAPHTNTGLCQIKDRCQEQRESVGQRHTEKIFRILSQIYSAFDLVGEFEIIVR